MDWRKNPAQRAKYSNISEFCSLPPVLPKADD